MCLSSCFAGGKTNKKTLHTNQAHPSAHTAAVYKLTHTLRSPRSLPEFSNTSPFLGIADVKQKHKSITYLGCSGREGSCRLRPIFIHIAKTASVCLPSTDEKLQCFSSSAYLLRSVKSKRIASDQCALIMLLSSAHGHVWMFAWGRKCCRATNIKPEEKRKHGWRRYPATFLSLPVSLHFYPVFNAFTGLMYIN